MQKMKKKNSNQTVVAAEPFPSHADEVEKLKDRKQKSKKSNKKQQPAQALNKVNEKRESLIVDEKENNINHEDMKDEEISPKVQKKDKRKRKSVADESDSNVVETDENKINSKRQKTQKGEIKDLKLSKKEKKHLRKAQKDEVKLDLSVQAKRIWDDLRKHEVEDEERVKLCTSLWELVKGNVMKIIYAHDTARVIECLMKYADANMKNELFAEIKDHLLEMSKRKYAKFVVMGFLKHGGNIHRDAVIQSLRGEIRKLVKHSEASQVVEVAYSEVANATQRSAILSEFYGSKFAYLKDDYKQTLPSLLASHPSGKDLILRSTLESLLPLTEHEALRQSVVHRALRDFLECCGESMRREMVEALHLSLPYIIHTRDGAKVCMYTMWNATEKERVEIVLSFKTLVSKACCDENGYLVVLALLDAISNVKLLAKIFIQEITDDLETIVTSKFGQKVLLYLLAYRHPLIFHPDVAHLLKQGDGRSKESLEEKKSRFDKLIQPTLPNLASYISKHVEDMIRSSPAFLQVTLTHYQGDLKPVYQSISQLLINPHQVISSAPTTSDTIEPELINIENVHLVFLLKKLIAHDTTQYKSLSKPSKVLFSQVLLHTVPEEVLNTWIVCNRGCFALVWLLESEIPVVISQVADSLKKMKRELKASKLKGAAVILKKI